MKKEKNKNNPFCTSNNKYKYRSTFKEKTHIKNPTTKLEMNLSHPIKINMTHSKEKLNLLESNSFKSKITISPKQFLLSKDKIIISDHKNQKNINKNKKTENYLKHSINLAKNTSSDNINYPHNKIIASDKNESNINNNEHRNENETSMDNDDFYKVPQNKIKFTIVSPNKKNNNNNMKNYNTPNNFNQVYPNDPFNNDLFSNLFIDSSTDNKNILISELDIELSNIEQSNINNNNNNTENQNMNFIDDEEDTNQKSNEHINVYKKIELRFKSELEKNLKKYFQKNGANFYIGDSKINNNINHIKKETEIPNKNKSKNNIKKEGKQKKDIKKVINSDGKMLHNINFTIDLRENCNKFNNINNSKLRLIKNNIENDNNKKYKKIIEFSGNKFKTNIINNINNNIMNRKSLKKKVKKEVSNKKKSTKQNMNSSSKTKTIEGEKKIKSIYSKVMTDEKNKTIKYKNSKEKGQEKYLNKNDNNTKKNNSTGIRQTYKNSPYYLHSINSIKTKKNNNNLGNGNYNFKYNYNQLYHHKLKNKKNNIFIGEISITSSNNTQRKNLDETNKNNITYLNTNSKSVKNKNKLNRFFSFGLYEDKDKEPFNNKTQRSQTKIINNIDINHNLKKKTFKSYNYKKRGKPLNNYKGLNTEINNFNKIINFSIKSGHNKNDILNKKKKEITDNKDHKDDLIKKKNLNNKAKSDLEDYDENSVFIYNKNKGIFLGYNPYENILQNNSFKKI